MRKTAETADDVAMALRMGAGGWPQPGVECHGHVLVGDVFRMPEGSAEQNEDAQKNQPTAYYRQHMYFDFLRPLMASIRAPSSSTRQLIGEIIPPSMKMVTPVI